VPPWPACGFAVPVVPGVLPEAAPRPCCCVLGRAGLCWEFCGRYTAAIFFLGAPAAAACVPAAACFAEAAAPAPAPATGLGSAEEPPAAAGFASAEPPAAAFISAGEPPAAGFASIPLLPPDTDFVSAFAAGFAARLTI